MRKVWAIAAREYKAAVQTKAFLVSLIMMPVLMAVSIGAQVAMRLADTKATKAYAAIDRTGQLRPGLEAILERYNTKESIDEKTGVRDATEYKLAFVAPSADTPDAILQQRYELGQKVRAGEYEGLLDIGPAALDVLPPGREADDRQKVLFLSEKAEASDFRRWAQRVVNEAVHKKRLADKGVAADVADPALAFVFVQNEGLPERDPATGALRVAQAGSREMAIARPGLLLVMMYMFVLLGAMPAMQGVVEEKQQRIAEVLLGSVTPFGLMLGKLLGVVGVSLTVSIVYLGGGYIALAAIGLGDIIAGPLLAWFVVYLVLAVLMYGSLFMAVGAAAGDMKETQTLSMPVMMLATLPMLMLGPVLRDPGSSLAVAGSFVPFATPMLMVARLASPVAVPWWHPVVGVVLVLAVTAGCVWAAGRIFRVGLLMQGKGVKFADLARWVVSG